MGFENTPKIRLESDEVNAQQPLGKTAYYDPNNSTVTVFVSGRHPKDIMRSISHELVHHTQNGRGEFEKVATVGEGYAQNDDHLREMEREAYEQGNLCFRDWEDSVKTQNEELNMFEKRNKKLNERMMKKFGYVNEIHTAADLAGDDAGTYSPNDAAYRQDKMHKENEALERVMDEVSKKVPVSKEMLQAANILYWEDVWPSGAVGQELYDALDNTIGTNPETGESPSNMDKTDLGADPYGFLADRLKEVVQNEVSNSPDGMAYETVKKVKGNDLKKGDKVEDPDGGAEGDVLEPTLVRGKEGATAEFSDEEAPEAEVEPEEEEELKEEPSSDFDKEYGEEFSHLFVESEKEDEDDTDDVGDDDAEGDPVPYLEEDSEDEDLYSERNKRLHERLVKWSSK
jgi:hypothetical protein